MTQLGTLLRWDDQLQVLASYIHRFTEQHRPTWVKGNVAKYPHFTDDNDWLRNTRFHVRKNGRLDQRYKGCYSKPTWPKGQQISGHKGTSILDHGKEN